MPDIALRFHKDMLVLSSPLDAALRRAGFDPEQDLEYIGALEPEAVRDALRQNAAMGAPVLVAPTAGLTPARLAHHGAQDRAPAMAAALAKAALSLRPQHLLLELGPCGLPLDPASKASLNENRDQYARAARAFAETGADGILLSGFTGTTDLKCALMGVRQVTGLPVIAAVRVDAQGRLAKEGATLEDALAVAREYGASAAGFVTDASPDEAATLAARAVAATPLPVFVGLDVPETAPCRYGVAACRPGAQAPVNPYADPDALADTAVRLRAAGAQLLRATGAATASQAGVLAVAVGGLDVTRPDLADEE